MAIGRGLERFFPPARLTRLHELVDLHVVEPPVRDPAAYRAVLERAQAEIVITGWDSPRLSPAVFAATPQLRYLCHVAGTVRSVVDRAVLEAGLLVTNWGDAAARTVAEAALLGILSCLRRTTYVDLLMHRDRGWMSQDDKATLRSLFGRRVGLHGFGSAARALVHLLAPFQCEVVSYDPYVEAAAFERHGVVPVPDLHTLYSTSDVVSIHCSSTPETRRVVSRALLQAMRPGAVLVNTARAAVVDMSALAETLASRRLAASLDVFDVEPLPPGSPLRSFSNCQLTCHSAGPTLDRMSDAGDVAIENIQRYVEGGLPLLNVIDLERYDRAT